MSNYLKYKIRRPHKGVLKYIENKHNILKVGDHGLKSLESGRISAAHLELLRRYLRRKLKFIYKRKKRKVKAKFLLCFQCQYILTKKPAEIRMGKGKGAVDNYIYRIKTGKVLFEVFGLSFFILKRIFNKIKQKLPVKTFLIKKLINV